MKLLQYISLALVLILTVFPLLGQKEKDFKEQALDDVRQLSSEDFPYMERFHEAVRESLVGNLEEARSLFEECLAERSNDDAVHFGLATIAMKQNSLTEARTHFQRAHELDRLNDVYLEQLAQTLYEQGDFEAAKMHYKELVQRKPRNVDWIYGYSQVLIYTREYKLAADMLGKLTDQVGIVPEIMTMKADLYQEIGELDKAEHVLLTLFNEHPERKESLHTLIDFYRRNEMQDRINEKVNQLSLKHPQNMVLKMKLASIYAKEGNQEALIKKLKPIIQSESVDIADKVFHIEQLLTFFEVEKTELLELTGYLVETEESDPMAALLHAEVLTQNNQSKSALPYYRKAIEKDADQFEIWSTVLAFESAYKDYPALYEDGNKALTYFPTLPFVYYAAAEGAIWTGRAEEALDIITAGELYLLDNKEQQARFAMRKGQAYFALNEYKKGIQYFEKALALWKSPGIHINYAFCLANAGIALKVAKEQLNLVDKDEKKTNYYLAKAQLLIAQKDFSSAENIIREGLNFSPYKAELYDRLGDVLFLKGDQDKAISYWEKAQKTGSRNTQIGKKIKEKKFHVPKYY